MEYFRSGLKTVLGTSTPDQQPTSAETIERLIWRVSTSTLLEDRRDACRAIRALSRRYRLEVGAQGIDVLRRVLELDRSDCEIIGYCLDTLCNITSKDIFEEEKEDANVRPDIGEQFTEIFIKHPENISLVLTFLEEYDFRVRLPAIRLLTSLLANRPKEIQEAILIHPMGVSKLVDLLSEQREVIRNDALLLLVALTHSNANIQKIVAFENAFDHLFEVIIAEGGTDGGIVVEDCLMLMLNLLTNNTSNISFFREGSYIQRLAPMFVLPENLEEIGWSPQKIANMHCLLHLIRTLVTPNNPLQLVASCQKIIRNAGLLEALCNILMANGVPADILTETINAVAEVIRANLTNQEYFANVLAPSTPPRPALVVLLMSMVNEKQPFQLRCAVLYCFVSFLYKNEIGQEQVVQTLLPSTATNNTSDQLTTGQLLCGGLFSTDASSNWFSAVALSHTLIDNPAQKERLLRVLLATNLGAQPISLLQQCASFVQSANRLQSKLGVLMLLATWLTNCLPAVRAFMNCTGTMAFLTAQSSASDGDIFEELLQSVCAFIIGLCLIYNDNTLTNYSKDMLAQLVEKRIGMETYCKKLNELSRHEIYARTSKQPQLKIRHAQELLLEYEFCKLYKTTENIIIKSLGMQQELSNGMSELSLSEQENALLSQYKELIREQDRKLQECEKARMELEKKNLKLQTQIDELEIMNEQLNDRNTLLKAQLSTGVELKSDDHQKELLERTQELERLRKDQDDLLELLSDQDQKLAGFRLRLKQLGEVVDEDSEEDEDDDNNTECSENDVIHSDTHVNTN